MEYVVSLIKEVYSLTKPIPWSRILFEKPEVAQLLKNFATFYGTRGFIAVFVIALLMSIS
jgi:hypothetical protein